MERTAAGPDDDAASRMREDLIDRLCRWRVIESPTVDAVMRSVPRHRFVPEVPTERAYADEAVVTKRKPDGASSSSASQPMIVAWQLEQLEAGPGERVLEIGAGTGYNAALLAEVVGPSGRVTSVEFDPEVADRARRSLEAQGYGRVRVVTGDGEFGCRHDAPYDRIIVTTGAWDIPPAWGEQIRPGGRLVTPLRLPGWPMSIGFDRADDFWRSTSTRSLGFIPVDGAGAYATNRVPLAGSAVELWIEDDRDVERAALAGVLTRPRHEAWTGLVVDNGTDWDHLHLWLTATVPGFCTVRTAAEAVRAGTVTPLSGWGGPAVHDGASIAYVTNRRAVGGGTQPHEVGVVAHGPAAATLAANLVDRLREWHEGIRTRAVAAIEVHPLGAADRVPTGAAVFDKRHNRIAVSFTPRAGGAP